MPRIAPTSPSSPTGRVSLAEIDRRTVLADKIQKIFTDLKPGQKLANADAYFIQLDRIVRAMSEDCATLYNPKIKVTKQVEQARVAIQKQIAVIQRVADAAKARNIVPTSSVNPAGSSGNLPWSGKLRDNKDTPLHWAVRNHDHTTAVGLSLEMRQQRLASLCQHFAGTSKNPKIAAIFKNNPNILVKLLPAIEMLHAVNYRNLDDKALKLLIKDPDILMIVKDPNFRKILSEPQSLAILDGFVILFEQDSRGIAPIEEAVLQGDPEMVDRLLFPHLHANEQLKQIFSARSEELKGRMAILREVDPERLSDICKAAYRGDMDQLMMESDFRNIKDENGLTPLHYAILGGQDQAISYLLFRSDLYTLTKEGHSYFDYAILAGRGDLLNYFQQMKVPFKLGNERERFSYVYASGIFHQQLTKAAHDKDPLAAAGTDQNLPGTPIPLNLLWAGAAAVNRYWDINPAAPATRLGSIFGFLETQSNVQNHLLGVGQVLGMLPTWMAQPIGKGYAYLQLALFSSSILCGLTGYYPQSLMTNPNLNNALNKISGTFAVCRMIAAIKPLIVRAPVYRDNFTSRPTKVVQSVVKDLFNIGTQYFMSRAYWQ
jgi:ankyrin repeat protein